jgi:TonB family protein
MQAGLARLDAELRRVEVQLQNVRLGTDDRARAERLYRAILEQYRDTEQQFRAVNAQQLAEEQARARLREAERRLVEARVSAEQLQTAERQLEAAGRQPEETTTSTVSPTPTTPFDGTQQLKSPSGRTPIRVTPPMKPPVPIKTAQPQYSAEALQARLQGTVAVEVLVDEKGHVADARVLRSIPLLDKAALEAARQWEFTPTLMNGEPVPVLLQLEMNFTLK